MSTPVAGSAKWHAERANGIGGSDVEKFLGLSPFGTPRELYDEKVGLREPEPSSKAAERGKALEPTVLKMLGDNTGLTLLEARQFVKHSGWDDGYRLQANVDALAIGRVGDRKVDKAIAEAKTSRAGGFVQRLVDDGDIPLRWKLQAHHYAACWRLTDLVLAGLLGPSDEAKDWTADRVEFFCFHMSTDWFLVRLIEDACRAWWGYVEDEIPPPRGRHPSAMPIQKQAARVDLRRIC